MIILKRLCLYFLTVCIIVINTAVTFAAAEKLFSFLDDDENEISELYMKTGEHYTLSYTFSEEVNVDEIMFESENSLVADSRRTSIYAYGSGTADIIVYDGNKMELGS